MKTRYFVDPDSSTNRVIFNMLGQKAEEATCSEMVCADGESRNLWELSKEQVEKLEAEVGRLRLRFVVYRQIRGGKIQKWKTLEPPKEPEVSVVLPGIPQTAPPPLKDTDQVPF